MLQRPILFLSLVLVVAAVGCGGGASQADVDAAVAAAESRMQAKVDQQEADLERIAEEAAEAHADAEHARRDLELALCEADYWAVAAWSAITALPDYIQSSPANYDPVSWWRSGIKIKANYGEWSRVCYVDEEGRWQLRFQPAVLPSQRLDR